jgi:3-methyladenine DNA glycosylase AlkC
MAEPLKDMFNKKFYEHLALEFSKADKNFHPEKFVKEVSGGQDELSLIQRMRKTTITLKDHLPDDYKRSLPIILKVAPEFRSHFTSFLFPDFVGQYGHDHVSLSLDALKELTPYGSSEFAIREYLKRDLKRTLKTMNKWADDKDHHVRRLASEGCRPRLPWSFNIPEIMKDPGLTLPILEKLKADNELYVKKSVANHLNDFSRVQTDWMLNVIKSWDKKNEHTAWIIKHASRTLIKKGHPASLSIFNFEKNVKTGLKNFKLEKSKISLGDDLNFSFQLISEKKQVQKLVIDYAIHYAKKSGGQSRKVFKLKELVLQPMSVMTITKKQSFKDFSTRKHYTGKHAVEILVNGKSYGKKEFLLSV